MATLNKKRVKVKDCRKLLEEYVEKDISATNPVKLNFQGIGNKDVYNITAPFEEGGFNLIAGRVESRNSEHSFVMFFTELNGQWVPHATAPVLTLQDPFYSRIGGELILGGVEISPHPTLENILNYRTVFYKGRRITELKRFFTGPDGMKDLRLIELEDGSIGIFTRPQGEKGGRGKIGFTSIASLDHLTIEVIKNTPLMTEQFIETEWGGANEAHLLSNGLIGILGHIACFDVLGDRHYYPMVFSLYPRTGEYSEIELIACRSCFLPGPAKRTDLVDVVFSGGLIRNKDQTADLYTGISDAEAHRITISDPFIKFEKLGASLDESLSL
jgi:hypothetical protein